MHDRAVNDSVQQRHGHRWIAQLVGPVVKVDVRHQGRRAATVAVINYLLDLEETWQLRILFSPIAIRGTDKCSQYDTAGRSQRASFTNQDEPTWVTSAEASGAKTGSSRLAQRRD